jgi:hypothetical protein
MKKSILLSLAISSSVYAQDVAVIESIHHKNHADNIVDIIGKKNSKLYLTNLENNYEYIKTLNKVANGNESIVNMSIQSCEYNLMEERAIRKMIRRGKTVVVSAGNKDFSDCTIYPANYKIKGMIVVGSLDSHTSNVDIVVKNDRHCIEDKCLHGSSQATAKVSRRLVEKKNGKR